MKKDPTTEEAIDLGAYRSSGMVRPILPASARMPGLRHESPASELSRAIWMA